MDGDLEAQARGGLRLMLVAYVAIAVGASIQQRVLGTDNNFEIFRHSFYNLVAGRDLYAAYPAWFGDRFKYSPSFAFLFGPIAVLPVPLGLLIWNLINATALWFAIARLLPAPAALIAMFLVFPELIGSLQSAQSNALVGALVIAAFVTLEGDRPVRAAAAVALGVVIKIFPAAAITLAVHDRERRRFAMAFVAAMVGLAALPLIVTSPSRLLAQYDSWRAIERVDALAGVVPTDPHMIGGVMQQLRLWSGVHWANWPVQLAGTIVLVLPLVARARAWNDRRFRLLFLASLLLFMVIFNHQAESPTFVIAMAGVAIWYVAAPRDRVDFTLVIGALIFTSLASSDLVPGAVRARIVRPYGVKAIPCIVIWLVLQAELLGFRRPRRERSDLVEADPLDPAQRAVNGA